MTCSCNCGTLTFANKHIVQCFINSSLKTYPVLKTASVASFSINNIHTPAQAGIGQIGLNNFKET